MNKREVDNILYFGKVNPENIPDIMSSLDILLLPSLNEGMPRVTLEALACGVHVVGSDVGGIPESIGEENAFALDENFIKNISDRIITLLQNGENPRPLSEEFSWKKAINKEMKVYSSILSRIKNVKCTPYEDLKNL
jgi:glycosyltransferase involved in cell wall biosynthesis